MEVAPAVREVLFDRPLHLAKNEVKCSLRLCQTQDTQTCYFAVQAYSYNYEAFSQQGIQECGVRFDVACVRFDVVWEAIQVTLVSSFRTQSSAKSRHSVVVVEVNRGEQTCFFESE